MLSFRRNKKGATLIFAYVIIVALLTLTGAVFFRALNESNLVRRNRIYQQAFYLAESGLAQASYVVAYREANFIDVNNNNSNLNLNLNPDFAVTYGWIDLYGAAPDDAQVDALGITNFMRRYQIISTARNTQTGISVTLNQIVFRVKTYTFQHAVFYEDDLEILPGPVMNFSGRIHSNHDIYLGTHSTLTVNSNYLYSAGSIFNRRKDSTQAMEGAVNILKRNSSPASYDLMKKASDAQSLDSARSDWTDESQNRWGGTVKSSVHGVTSLTTPRVGSIASDGFYASHAGLKIVDSVAYNASGTRINFVDNPISTSTFYDARESKNVTVTNINMQKLNASGNFPANGLIYVTRSEADLDHPNGIRLTNASELSARLTIVSNNPVYVRGDYNSVNKKPAAIISDTLNILSNNWRDTNSSRGISDRVATDTTVNAAFIAGVNPTVGSTYSGGLENYPHLLEDWSGKTLSIRGCFVQLWGNQISSGTWRPTGVYYNAPNRNWDYDLDFNNSANLPPFTPFAIETRRVIWWKS